MKTEYTFIQKIQNDRGVICTFCRKRIPNTIERFFRKPKKESFNVFYPIESGVHFITKLCYYPSGESVEGTLWRELFNILFGEHLSKMWKSI